MSSKRLENKCVRNQNSLKKCNLERGSLVDSMIKANSSAVLVVRFLTKACIYLFVAIFCNFTSTGLLEAFDVTAPTAWTAYSNSYVATSTSTRLVFSSATDQSNKDWYVDNVSVFANGGAGTNLIHNGNFENSSSSDWLVYSCSSACSAAITASTACTGGTGRCYHNDCTPATNIQFLEQHFTTVVGVTYNITFMALKGGSGLGSGTAMFVNVF